MRTPRIEVLADAEALVRTVAGLIFERASAKSGSFAVCLSGGSTPRRLYEVLAGGDFAERFPWRRVHWFWGDERFVPEDDPRNNACLAREALLARVPVPDANIHPIPTVGMTPADAAVAYERELKLFHGAEALDPARPLFDVALLGLGEDGHTASLFPATPVLDEHKRWVAAVNGVATEPRITLTYPALDSSRLVAVLASGAGKRAVAARILRGDGDLPASRLDPVGELLWFLDRAAAPQAPLGGGRGQDCGDRDARKRQAALRAVDEVADGMVVGLGSGSTMRHALAALAARVRSGLRIAGIPTSEATAALARELGIPLTSLADHGWIDLTIDGADEVERDGLALIKGRGGALLREKIVASASERVVIAVDDSKLVDRLGAADLPVEIAQFGWEATSRRLGALGAVVRRRSNPDGAAFVTDGGNYILDCAFGPIADPDDLAARLAAIPGVVESGLFLDLADIVIVAGADGISILGEGEKESVLTELGTVSFDCAASQRAHDEDILRLISMHWLNHPSS